MELDELTKAIENDPSDHVCYQKRAAFYLKQKNYVAALTDISRAIDLESLNPELFAWRSLVYLAMKNYTNALLDNQVALDFIPTNPDYLQQHAVIAHETGHYAEAMEYRKKAIEFEPENSYNHEQFASTSEALGDHAEALCAISRAIELEPDHASYYWVRAEMLRQHNNHTGAVEDLTRAIKLDPENVEYYRLRSNSYHSLGQFALGLEDHVKVVRLLYHPEDITYKEALGRTIKEQVVALLEAGSSQHTPLMEAASRGDLDRINALLNQGRDPVSVQAAFELAADTGQTEVARRLVTAGADYDFEYYNQNRDTGEGRRCPFCYTMCSMNEFTSCAHLIDMQLEGYESEDHDYNLDHLEESLDSLNPKELEELLQESPKEIADLFKQLHDTGNIFSSNDPELIRSVWYSNNNDGTVEYYFHPDPSFSSTSGDADEAIRWMKENRLDLCSPFEDSFGDEDFNTGLKSAIKKGQPERVKIILELWPDAELDDSVIEAAVTSKKKEIIEVIANANYSVLERLLENAVRKKKIALVKRLLEGCDPEKLDIQKLYGIADKLGFKVIRSLLVKAGAEPDN